MVFDPATGSTRRFRPYYLPLLAGPFDFSPSGIGIINDGFGLAEQLQWVRPRRLVPLKLRLARAGSPRFSPDGRWIAVDGVPARKKRISPATSTLPRTLYLVSADGRTLRPVLRDLPYVGRAAWSPDGRWLALALDPNDGQEGLWLVEATTGRHFLLLPGRQFGSTEWLPDGRTVIASAGVLSLIPGANKLHGKSKVGLYVLKLPDLRHIASRR